MQMNSAVDNVDLLRASANREMEVECKNLAARVKPSLRLFNELAKLVYLRTKTKNRPK
jgi:hypothetical protein